MDRIQIITTIPRRISRCTPFPMTCYPRRQFVPSTFMNNYRCFRISCQATWTNVCLILRIFPLEERSLRSEVVKNTIFCSNFILRTIMTNVPQEMIMSMLSIFPMRVQAILFISSIPYPRTCCLIMFFPINRQSSKEVCRCRATSVNGMFLRVLTCKLYPYDSTMISSSWVVLIRVKFRNDSISAGIKYGNRIRFRRSTIFRCLLRNFTNTLPMVTTILPNCRRNFSCFLLLYIYIQNDSCVGGRCRSGYRSYFRFPRSLGFLPMKFRSVQSWRHIIHELWPYSSALGFPSLGWSVWDSRVPSLLQSSAEELCLSIAWVSSRVCYVSLMWLSAVTWWTLGESGIKWYPLSHPGDVASSETSSPSVLTGASY